MEQLEAMGENPMAGNLTGTKVQYVPPSMGAPLLQRFDLVDKVQLTYSIPTLRRRATSVIYKTIPFPQRGMDGFVVAVTRGGQSFIVEEGGMGNCGAIEAPAQPPHRYPSGPRQANAGQCTTK